MGEETKVLDTCWNCTQLGCGFVFVFLTNSKSVSLDLEPSTGFLKSGSQLLPRSDVSAEVQLQSRSAVPRTLLFRRSNGVLHCQAHKPSHAALRPACPPVLLLCELTALIRTCSEISGLPFVAGWRHAVSKGFFGVEFFPSFVPAKLQCLFHVVPWGFPL